MERKEKKFNKIMTFIDSKDPMINELTSSDGYKIL